MNLSPRPAADVSLMMGYDFHITAGGPRFVEINTNAGGNFLVATANAHFDRGKYAAADLRRLFLLALQFVDGFIQC